jgi:prepilin-type N-terminal cleavage/methylation domain-containing protein
MKTDHTGFTLVEMAIVLAIIAFILGAGLTLLAAQQDQRRIEDTNALLIAANEALIGFALSQTPPYLPCPDKTSATGTGTANDGQEDRTTLGSCVVQEGNLPWVTLGLTPQTDAWSNRLRYRVTDHFSNSSTGIQLTFVGDINVYDSAAAVNSIVTAVPAVIVSHGKNGLGAINATGMPNAAAVASADEQANAPVSIVGHTTFVSHSANPAESGYFDDQLIWLSQYTLFNRMVQAGKLP